MNFAKNNFLILALILIFGGILRFLDINSFPPSLNWDEVSLGYNAYSLLHTGRDEWGVAFPAIFQAYGDYKLPVYVYAAVLPIRILGLTPLAVRLPSLMSGCLLILLAYVLSRRLFRRSEIAAILALLVAVEPWGLFLSRVAVEANLCLLFITLGITLLITQKYFFSALFLGLSVWTYNSARVFTPLFLLGFFLIRSKHIRLPLPAFLTSALFLVPMLAQLLSPSGQARFNWVNLLDSGAIARIEASRAASALPAPFPRLFYNRPAYFLTNFSRNYLSYFSPLFLFVSGGSQYQFNIPHTGLLSLVNLPLFFLGLVFLIKTPSSTRRVILLWLLLAPVAGSITRDSPHALRSLIMYPAVLLVIGLGYQKLFSWINWLKHVYLLLIFITLGYFLLVLSPAYIKTYSWSWQYGYSQAVQYIKSNYSDYDEIIFSKKYGEPHEFVLFYWPWSPSAYLSDARLNRYFRSDWTWVDSFANFKFVNDWDMPEYVSQLPPGKRYLIISSPENLTAGHVVSRIDFLDGQPAFILKSL